MLRKSIAAHGLATLMVVAGIAVVGTGVVAGFASVVAVVAGVVAGAVAAGGVVAGKVAADVEGAGVAAEVMVVDEVDGAAVRPVSHALPLSTRTAATVTTRIRIMAALYRATTIGCVLYGRPKSIRPMASVRGSPTSIVMVTVTASTRLLPHMLQ